MVPGDSAPNTPPLSAAEKTYETIRIRILNNEIEGGTLLSEGEFATELGVSRTPVREAFLRLQAEGWMRLFPKRGALVVAIAPGENREVVQARQLLETHAVTQICKDQSAVAALCETLTGIINRQRLDFVAGDLADFAEADADFHAAIVHAGGNTLLAGFYAGLRDRQKRMSTRSIWASGDRSSQIIDDHLHLIETIRHGDSEQFDDALSHHMRTVHRDLLS